MDNIQYKRKYLPTELQLAGIFSAWITSPPPDCDAAGSAWNTPSGTTTLGSSPPSFSPPSFSAEIDSAAIISAPIKFISKYWFVMVFLITARNNRSYTRLACQTLTSLTNSHSVCSPICTNSLTRYCTRIVWPCGTCSRDFWRTRHLTRTGPKFEVS